jgi:hypothetical protein
MKPIAGLILSIFVGSQALGAITTSAVNIDTGAGGQAGANALRNTLGGPGITFLGNATGDGSATSAGTFTGGVSAGIGIESGIVLSSGSVNTIDSTNSLDNTSGAASGIGDADLNPLTTNVTTDTTFLRFDFQFGDGSVGGNLFFNYVFASEEYNEYSNSGFNDVFGFFLDGQNVALIPSTNTPVSINTVNGGNPFGVNAQNPQYYNNNDLTDGGPFFAFEFDGFTDVFQVTALNLGAGTHSIKLAISDVGDTAFDSAVFIQAGSFSTDPGVVPEPTSVLAWLGLAGCFAGARLRRRKAA